MYQVLTGLLWLNLLIIIFSSTELGNLAPAYLIQNLITDQYSGLAGLSLHGVFGLDFYYNKTEFAALICIVFLCASIAGFIIPESGKTKYLPAVRSMHLRAKIACALMIGISAAAFAAGVLDALQIDLVPFFTELGWMPAAPGWYSSSTVNNYAPTRGIISLVSLASLTITVFVFGSAAFISMFFINIGRDRYWQVEKWTLILTLGGIALILPSYIFVRDDSYAYYGHTVLLGGCYTSWVIGWIVLTFAWTCRTLLLMMMRRYESAAVDSDEPTCFACGYDLRMLMSDRCPECGTAVHPEVVSKLRADAELNAAVHAESRSTTR